MLIRAIITTAVFLMGTASVQAQVYECPGTSGETKYQGHPCNAGQAAIEPEPQRPENDPGIATQRYQKFLQQQDEQRAQRKTKRLNELAEGRARVDGQQERIAKKNREQALKQEKKCQRDLRIAQRRGQNIEFTCTGSGYAARPRLTNPAVNPRPARPINKQAP